MLLTQEIEEYHGKCKQHTLMKNRTSADSEVIYTYAESQTIEGSLCARYRYTKLHNSLKCSMNHPSQKYMLYLKFEPFITFHFTNQFHNCC